MRTLMNQGQKLRRWWRDARLAWALATLVLAGLLTTTILGYWQKWAWIELLWRWLELLIIPAALGIGAFLLNREARHEDTLQRYLDRMSELVLDKKLPESKPHDAVRAMARARTLTALRNLDGNRKGQLLRFLYEAGLIGRESSGEWLETIIDLRFANLKGANLWTAYLECADLTGAKGWTNEQLAQAESLEGTTMPYGMVMTREDDEEFRNRYL